MTMTFDEAVAVFWSFGIEIAARECGRSFVCFGLDRGFRWMTDQEIINEADVLLNY